MRIIDRYVTKSMLSILLSAILIFCFLYILIDMASNLSEIIDRKVPFQILFEYYLSSLPIILAQTSTVACLIAVLFTFSSLNNNNEIIVLRSAGLNFWQISKSAIAITLVVSAVLFWLNERYVPRAAT